MAQQRTKMTPSKKLPLWALNLILFGLLIGVVLGYFFWQGEKERQVFFRHSREHSELLAKIIQLNADNAMAAGEAVTQAARTFLINSAGFIDYLAAIEPFTASELTALALESGLSGITINHNDHLVSGPPGWDQSRSGDGSPPPAAPQSFEHDEKRHLFILDYRRRESDGFLRLGFDALPLELLQKRVGLDRLLRALGAMPGISYISVAAIDGESLGKKPVIPVDKQVIEARLPLGNQVLKTGFDASYLARRRFELWRDFSVFSLLLGALGLFFSWLLYRYQSASLKEAQIYEQQLAREREDAALGRAAAAIAHEIRNPLNAINIGLQRLQIEDSGLSGEYEPVVEAMRAAVGRADKIVGDLGRFAQPLTCKSHRIDPAELFAQISAPYQAEGLLTTTINDLRPTGTRTITADPDLLALVFGNLCKNALEAQPGGGIFALIIENRDNELHLIFENPGLEIEVDKLPRLTEPWFTTKTRGSGLGLAMVERIARAHQGSFSVSSPTPGVLRQKMVLPTDKPEGK